MTLHRRCTMILRRRRSPGGNKSGAASPFVRRPQFGAQTFAELLNQFRCSCREKTGEAMTFQLFLFVLLQGSERFADGRFFFLNFWTADWEVEREASSGGKKWQPDNSPATWRPVLEAPPTRRCRDQMARAGFKEPRVRRTPRRPDAPFRFSLPTPNAPLPAHIR